MRPTDRSDLVGYTPELLMIQRPPMPQPWGNGICTATQECEIHDSELIAATHGSDNAHTTLLRPLHQTGIVPSQWALAGVLVLKHIINEQTGEPYTVDQLYHSHPALHTIEPTKPSEQEYAQRTLGKIPPEWTRRLADTKIRPGWHYKWNGKIYKVMSIEPAKNQVNLKLSIEQPITRLLTQANTSKKPDAIAMLDQLAQEAERLCTPTWHVAM